MFEDHYWIVGGDETRLFSSAAKTFVPDDNKTYATWLEQGFVPTRIKSEQELWEVLADHAPSRLPDDRSAVLLTRKRVEAIGATELHIAFDHENRLRALEGEAPIELERFKEIIGAAAK